MHQHQRQHTNQPCLRWSPYLREREMPPFRIRSPTCVRPGKTDGRSELRSTGYGSAVRIIRSLLSALAVIVYRKHAGEPGVRPVHFHAKAVLISGTYCSRSQTSAQCAGKPSCRRHREVSCPSIITLARYVPVLIADDAAARGRFWYSLFVCMLCMVKYPGILSVDQAARCGVGCCDTIDQWVYFGRYLDHERPRTLLHLKSSWLAMVWSTHFVVWTLPRTVYTIRGLLGCVILFRIDFSSAIARCRQVAGSQFRPPTAGPAYPALQQYFRHLTTSATHNLRRLKEGRWWVMRKRR